MASGVVRFFSSTKDYGFIVPDSGGSDIFVHRRELRASQITAIKEGDRLTYETEPGKEGKGPRAVRIALVPQA